jgi:hypothetical protein
MNIESMNELDAERTVIIALLQGRDDERAQLDADYQAALSTLNLHVDWLRQRREIVGNLLKAERAA